VEPIDPFGLIGHVLDGQFRIDGYVGEGGFSVVYGGVHTGLNEPIAVKCLKLPHALGSALVDSFVQRFRDESRIHYRLPQGHLHIVRSIASGTTTSPTTSALIPYMVLEWLEGRSLADEFDERRASGHSGRSLVEVVKLLDSAADALAYAHAQGVVHRDFNPGNLFLAKTQSGTKLKVLDFGVAKIMADSAIALAPLARTLGNVRMFTPAYGAPEQFDERVGAIGPWTDVYAMALVVLEGLTDQPVMVGENLGDFAAGALADRRPTPAALGLSLGDKVDSVFCKAVALSPAARPQDAGEFWGMLKNAMRTSEPAAVHVEASWRSSPIATPAPTGPGGTLVIPQSGKASFAMPDERRASGGPRTSSPIAASVAQASQTASTRPWRAIRPDRSGVDAVTVPIARRGSSRLLLLLLFAAALAVLLGAAFWLHARGRL
jgi:serine/threonine-protein kinase